MNYHLVQSPGDTNNDGEMYGKLFYGRLARYLPIQSRSKRANLRHNRLRQIRPAIRRLSAEKFLSPSRRRLVPRFSIKWFRNCRT